MSLRLIYGRIGSGKTSLCLREAIESGRHVYFITPEQFTFTAEKRICDLVNVHGLGGVEVISLKRLAHRFLSVSEGASLPALDGKGKLILLEKILFDNADKLSALKKFSGEIGSAGALSKLLGELKRYMITPADLEESAKALPHLSEKLLDVATLYKAYQSVLSERFYDSDDVMLRFAKTLEGEDNLLDTDIYIDRFDGFDASEFAVIRALLIKARRVTVTLCFHPEDENMAAFTLHSRLSSQLLNLAREVGVSVEPAVVLETQRCADESLRFLEKKYFAYPTEIYEKNTDAIRLAMAQNPLGEVHSVARQILRLCREKGYLYRDIAVSSRNTASYERYIEAVFPLYGIPYFMDKTIRILEHPFTVFVLSALELITGGYTYDAVFRYVKSGFLRIPLEEIDILENYVLATGIRGNIWKDEKKWKEKVSAYSHRESEADLAFCEKADKIRRKIVKPLLSLETSLKEGKSAAQKCEAIFSFLEEMKADRRILALCRLFERDGEFALASEYRGVYNDFIDALDGVCDAFGNEEINVRRLYDILRIALGEVETGIIPAAQDGVSVGDINRIKGYDVKALFVIGTVDGVFPAVPDTTGIFNDSERKSLSEIGLEIAHSENKTLLEEEHLIYKCLTIPREYIEVSYPAADMTGGVLRPSRIYNRIKELFPLVLEKGMVLGLADEDKISVPELTLQYVLDGIRCGKMNEPLRMALGWLLENREEETKKAIRSLSYENKTEKLSQETIKAYLGDNVYSSVSRLETLSKCPFSYFANYILSAKERQIMAAGASDVGSFLHDFIDIFSRRLKENRMKWQDVDEGYMDKEFLAISPILDARLSPYMMENSMRYVRLFTRLKKAVKTALGVLVRHMKRSRFEPLGYELSFSANGDLAPLSFTLPDGRKITLTGRIDRADVLKTEDGGVFVRVVDYKSGSKTFDLGDVFEGLDLQLCVYLSALCSDENAGLVGENACPSGVLYFKLIDPVVSASPLEDDAVIEILREKEFKVSGLLLGEEDVLKAMDFSVDTSRSSLPAKIGKAGPAGNIASLEQFKILEKYVKKTVTKLLSHLTEGEVSISPCKKENMSACDWCKFASFCAHDGSGFRRIYSLDKEEIWERMEAEICK